MDDNRIIKGLMLALIVCVPFFGLWATNRPVFVLCLVADFMFLVIYWGIGWEEANPYQQNHSHQNESRESRVWKTQTTQTQYPKRESYEQFGYEPESKT